jgi:hypothetical protein
MSLLGWATNLTLTSKIIGARVERQTGHTTTSSSL